MRDDFDCPVEDCEDCEFNRSQSWCAQALPEYKGHTKLEKIRMEGFWEALDWCEEHYKELEKWYWDSNDYTILLEQIIMKTFAENRAPTKEEVDTFKNFWEGKENYGRRNY